MRSVDDVKQALKDDSSVNSLMFLFWVLCIITALRDAYKSEHLALIWAIALGVFGVIASAYLVPFLHLMTDEFSSSSTGRGLGWGIITSIPLFLLLSIIKGIRIGSLVAVTVVVVTVVCYSILGFLVRR